MLTAVKTTTSFATLWGKQIPVIEKHWATSAGVSTYKSYNLAEDPITSYDYDVETTKSAPVTVFVGLHENGRLTGDFTPEILAEYGIHEVFPEEINALDSEDEIWEQLERSYCYQKTRKDFAEKAESLRKTLPEGEWRFEDCYSFMRLDFWGVTLKHEYYPKVELEEDITIPATVIELSIVRGGSLEGFLSLDANYILSRVEFAIKDRQEGAEQRYNSELYAAKKRIAERQKERQIRELRKAGKPIPKHLR